jgi:hypothetical protein
VAEAVPSYQAVTPIHYHGSWIATKSLRAVTVSEVVGSEKAMTISEEPLMSSLVIETEATLIGDLPPHLPVAVSSLLATSLILEVFHMVELVIATVNFY